MPEISTAEKLQIALCHYFNDPHYLSVAEAQSFFKQATDESIVKLSALCVKEKIISKEDVPPPTLKPKHFLDALYSVINNNLPINRTQWELFVSEFFNSIQNYTLFLIYRSKWTEILNETIKQSEHDNFWNWLESEKNNFDYLAFLEQWGTIGHPTHPTAKNRMGLSIEEVLKYSPEFQPVYNIFFVALQKSCAYHDESLDEDINTLFSKVFPNVYAAWNSDLKQQGIDPEKYWLLPTHPWQFENIISTKFSSLISEQKLILLNSVTLAVTPCISFRTVIPVSKTPKPHIKLPVSIRLTSVIRTVSPGTIRMSPRVGKLLQNILKKENNFTKSLYLCPDFIGVNVQTDPGHYNNDQCHLGTLIRKNPLTLINHDEIIVPLTTLFSQSPLSGLPLLIDIMHSKKIASPEKALIYFKNYASLTLHAFLDLYLIYGIALEAHKQNVLMVFKNHSPKQLINRDLGGIRIHTPTLHEKGFCLHQDAPTLILTTDASEVRHKLLHTVYQDHLISLINCIHSFYKIDHKILWIIISELTQERFIAIKEQVLPFRWEEEYAGILIKNWPIKSFTRMRLFNASGYIHIDSNANPLIHRNPIKKS